MYTLYYANLHVVTICIYNNYVDLSFDLDIVI